VSAAVGANPFIVAIVAVAIVNGMFSPLFLPQSVGMILVVAPALLITSPSLVFLFASLLAATATIMLSGVPAALFERATGRKDTDAASYAIWLATALLVSFPGLLQAFALWT
jgi:hypothetical protein